jgi:hypothetical protein
MQLADDSIARSTPAGAGLPPSAVPSMLAAQNLAQGLPHVHIEAAKEPVDE